MAKRKSGSAFGRFIKTLIRLAILFALVGILAMMLLAPNPQGKGEGKTDQLTQAATKLFRFSRNLENGQPARVALDEQQVNAYLYDIVSRRNKAEASGLTMRPSSMNFDIQGETAKMMIQSEAGPITLSYEVDIKPAPGRKPVFSVVSAKVGKLPMPGPLQSFVENKLEAMFSGLRDESALIAACTGMEFAGESVILTAMPE